MEQGTKTPRERAEDLIRLLVPDWRPTPQQGLWAIRIGIVLGLLVAIGYSYGITLWDWAKLLIVPAVIAAGGLWFNQQQQERQQEDVRRQRERELDLENDRAQEAAVQAYLDQLTQLLVTQGDEKLIRMQVDDEVRQVIHARSEPLLRGLTATRRWNLILFLSVMGLLTKDRPLVSLAEADLRDVDGRGAPLQRIALQEADLSGANLRGADLSMANLHRANLSRANLSRANLFRANLSRANLRGTTLFGADLSRAWLRNVEGVSNEELAEQVPKALEGATMPNGQKYEDWLNSRGEGDSGS